ncbi:MAG TPA: hypothetical protein VLX89_11110 [Actinomycetota bacterium]|nr:hypothetical protein [Actinomycetota bacterium]
MGITIFLVIAVVVVALVFAQRLNARRLLRDERRSTTSPSAPSPSPSTAAGSSDEITARIEDEVERMGITVAPEEIKRIADQIRAAKASGEGPDVEPEQLVDDGAVASPGGIVRARAVVVSVRGGTVPVELDVDVPGQGTRRVTVNVAVPEGRWRSLAAGTSLPVRVDPDDPTAVSVDWGAADDAPEQDRSAQ